jgi:hypothetical protein
VYIEMQSAGTPLNEQYRKIGYQDAAKGNALKDGMPEAYYLGYGERYQEDANNDARTDK